MNRTYLLVLLLGAAFCASAQTIVPPYNPDVDQDSAIGAGDLLGLLPLFGTYFTPSEVTVDGQTLTEYIAALEEAAGNATSDTITIPMLSGTAPGQMLYWNGSEWTLVPTGQSGDALMLEGATPTWRTLKTGCPDSLYLEYDPQATVDDGSCTTLIVSGCTDPAYLEYEAAANSDDGSCATLDTTGCAPVSMDGHTYSVVEIGDQCWFAENLRTTTYADGTAIPAGLTDGEWTSTISGATAVYGEDDGCSNNSPDIDACDEAQSLAEYGRLYNWYAVDDARGLCPTGWHVPTDGEWTDLEDFITAQGFSGSEGTALKSTYGWYGGGNGTDDFGLSALPGGYRDNYNGYFNNAGDNGNWWSSSPSGGGAWYRYLVNSNPVITRANNFPRYGFSVRCLRDADFSPIQGCTDPTYLEYDAAANTDDGSCATLIVNGCTDPAYLEFDAAANTDDGSCATLDTTGCAPVSMDGHTYSVVEIGDQCWFAENLRTTTYADGTVIPAGLTDGEWVSTTSGATAVYGEGSSTCSNYSPDIDACDEAQSLAEYGRSYNWYAVDDARGLCPSGWHVPTDGEWTNLEDYITAQGFDGTEGTALKSTYGWYNGGNGTDDFGFSALPGAGRNAANGSFEVAGSSGDWWSSSPSGGGAWYRYLNNSLPAMYRSDNNPRFGFSVRCLRDADFSPIQGCTDSGFFEFNAEANTDDGSCATLIVNGCTDPAYLEFDAAANTDDGSCSILVLEGCTDSDMVSMDGDDYDVVQIGDQCWFAENLRTTTYADGTAIPVGLTDGEWTSTTSGATAVYGEGSSDCSNDSADIDACDEAQSLEEYGRLYNWYAVDDARGLCPIGWHVPTDGEWTDLKDYITAEGFNGTEGTALKSTYGWFNGGNGTDDFGFSALPGGSRFSSSGWFSNAGSSTNWWSSSLDGGGAWSRHLSSISPDVLRILQSRRYGFSVRCLRDADYSPIQGCTDPGYLEYDAAANTDDGSCTTLIVNGCTDPAYLEFDAAANTDDGSCATLDTTGCAPATMDGYTYGVVEIGDQCWFAENLRTTTYLNGDVIPAGLTDGEWTSTTSGATAVFGEGSSPCSHNSPDIDACDEAQSLAEYGRLYNWYAVDDARGLCPSGWHVPTDGEWTDLEDYIIAQGFDGTEGTALKSTYGWFNGINGTDDFGFSALPGGLRDYDSGYFGDAGYYGSWWSSSPSGGDAWYRDLNFVDPVFNRSYDYPRYGFSIRCLRDAD